MAYLEIRNITKRFDKQTVLDGVHADIEKGEMVCVLGPSGCGKTTLLRIVAGLETADCGSVYINGRDCTALPPAKRNFGIVFQSYALFPNMTVAENILFGLRRKRGLGREEMRARVDEVLRTVDLSEHRNKYPRQLSGGQQQRAALARAIAPAPSYLLLDEPLSALDAKVRLRLRGEIRAVQRALGITTVMVTHDQEEALTMADKIIVMNRAAVEQIGRPREIYDRPATPFVASFIGAMNFYPAQGGMCAIRPERVEIAGTREGCDMVAEIKGFEFKGAMTRIYGVLPKQTEICVDIASDRADGIDISRSAKLYLRMPEEHLIKYPPAASRVM
ncbi:MAG: ATP-binding cassette domain-containing protein [Clostridiales Family XIII bacterium]|jgi:iron(III) transport system ATP-binding protein|nr:ATP-binding cassette domain-containing protein [Clostridiales Family XIII bacterium]